MPARELGAAAVPDGVPKPRPADERTRLQRPRRPTHPTPGGFDGKAVGSRQRGTNRNAVSLPARRQPPQGGSLLESAAGRLATGPTDESVGRGESYGYAVQTTGGRPVPRELGTVDR